jgi:hypothetical protein
MVNYSSNYIENPLNKYESYTYSWAIHMCHPQNSNAVNPATLKSSNRVITLAESGVENEISIHRVEQTFVFVSQDKQAFANQFKIDFIEVGGITFFSRILKAANDLNIENHLSATYILELNFKGQLNGTPVGRMPEVGTYYYICTMTNLGMSYQEGAAYYSGSLVETSSMAFNQLEVALSFETSIQASTFGEFLGKFQDELKKQAREVVRLSRNSLFPNDYVLIDGYGASSWAFGDPGTIEEARNVSVSGSAGNLNFNFPKGTSITTAITVALMNTDKQRRLPVGLRGEVFAKANANDLTAIPSQYANQLRWPTYETTTAFGRYDEISNNYQKRLTYTVIPTLKPDGTNDPDSHRTFNESKVMQVNKLKKYFTNGQLKKRYDYIHTGKNTEILNFDVSINNLFFTMQASLFGALHRADSYFPGGSSDGQTASVLLTQNDQIRTKIQEIQRQISELENRQRNSRGGGDSELIRIGRDIPSLQVELDDLIRQEEALAPTVNDALAPFQTGAFTNNVPSINRNRYITQSELYANSDINSNRESVYRMPFRFAMPNGSATRGPETNSQTIGALGVAALQSNLFAPADLLEISLQIRGDPWWLGQSNYNKYGVNSKIGGQSFFLNVIAPRYPDENTGWMLQENLVTYMLSGVYVVLGGTATYESGMFTMALSAYRDLNSQVHLIYDLLDQGYVTGDEIRYLESLNDTTDESVTGASGATQLPPEGSVPPGATGASSPGGHTLANNVNPVLNNVLTAAGNAAGVTVVTTSGYRAGPGSGRHLGDASDVALYSGGRRLSVSNAADRAIIATFSQNFINEARAQGYTPSVGAANHTYPPNQWYMNGNTFHYDIAVGNSIAADRSTVWGGSGETAQVRPPNWLTSLF